MSNASKWETVDLIYYTWYCLLKIQQLEFAFLRYNDSFLLQLRGSLRNLKAPLLVLVFLILQQLVAMIISQFIFSFTELCKMLAAAFIIKLFEYWTREENDFSERHYLLITCTPWCAGHKNLIFSSYCFRMSSLRNCL